MFNEIQTYGLELSTNIKVTTTKNLRC